jgi:hypothetical protein
MKNSPVACFISPHICRPSVLSFHLALEDVSVSIFFVSEQAFISFLISCAVLYKVKSRDSSVGIALDYGLDDQGSRVRFPEGLGILLFTSSSITALGPTQPPIQWVAGALSLGVKRPRREAGRSPPSSAEVKECVEHIPPLPQYAFMAWCLVKQRDKFTFTFTVLYKVKSRDSSVGTATGYGLNDRLIGVRFPAGVGNFSLRHRVQTGFGAQTASYTMSTGGFLPVSKAAGA